MKEKEHESGSKKQSITEILRRSDEKVRRFFESLEEKKTHTRLPQDGVRNDKAARTK